MRFRKRINKDSSRKVLHKINIQSIKKNSNIEKEHIITKIKRQERFYSLCLSFVFLIVMIGTLLLIGTSFNHVLSTNTFNSGDLVIEYAPIKENIGNIVTLTDSKIMNDLKVVDNEDYRFVIKNKSDKTNKYRIVILKDKDFIDLDGCKNNLFFDDTIKFNINKGSVKKFNEVLIEDGKYILVEDVIPANSSKMYSLNIWVDDSVNFEDRHFHGLIEVESLSNKA